MSSQEPTLSVQINQIDHTLAPSGPLDNSTLARVPIIRIYGASSTGQKACVHIHQVYPYFFVEYNGQMNPDSVNRYIAKLNHSLNHAIAISMKRNPHSPNSQFVRAILLVKGVHFYGFHTSYSPFLKILLVDPTFVSRAVTVMRAGTVMHTRFNVYESHLSYILQFLCDFGLYGCGWMNLGEVWQRGQDEEEQELKGLPTFNESPHFRQSRMPLEVDVAAHQILNRHLLVARNLHHKLTIPGPSFPPEPLVISVRELWEDERRRRLAKGLIPSPEIPVDPSESSRGTGGEWIAEARWWDEVRKRIEKEREGDVKMRESDKGWERFVMTTFESIEALWEQEWKVWRHNPRESGETEVSESEDGDDEGMREENPFGSASGSGNWNQTDSKPQNTEIDVDEALLSSQEMSRMVAVDEQEWAKLMGENRAIENEDDDEGQFDEDDDYFICDDGPPPGLQIDDAASRASHVDKLEKPSNDSLVSASPKTPRKRQNLSLENSSRQKRHRTSSVSDNPDFVRNSELTTASHVLPSHVPEGQAEQHRKVIEAARDSLWPQHEIAHRHSSNDREDTSLSSGFNLAAAKGILATHSQPNVIDPLQISSKMALSRGHNTTCINSEPQITGAIQNGNEHLESHETEAVELCSIHQPSSYKSSSDPSSIVTPKSTSSVAPTTVHLPSSLPTAITPNSNVYVYAVPPPSISELVGTIDDYAVPSKIYRNAYFSKESDAPDNPREYAGLFYHLKGGEGLNTLDEWNGEPTKSNVKTKTDGARKSAAQRYWPVAGGYEYASCPPSPREVRRWLVTDAGRRPFKKKSINTQSQIEGPTQTEHYDLKDAAAHSSVGVTRGQQSMSVFALEIFAPPRGNFVPDPDVDDIIAVFWSFQDPADELADNIQQKACRTGIIVVENKQFHPSRLRDFFVEVVDTELELLNQVVDVVMNLDPDIVTGWEIQAASWGYLSARGKQYGFDIGDLISRSPSRNLGGSGDQWGMRQTSTFRANGRQVLNLWRIMRSEQNLNMYSFENVVFHVLGKRIPQYNASTLTEWYKSGVPSHTARVLRYMSDRTLVVLEVLEEAEIVTKTAEFARVFGVDFFSVISRGSQFKVESFMFRIGKPESLVFLSPSKQDVGKQNAAECMPLIMEPLSAFYNGPLVVLDFQSLYPSIMIAYNYCYSTCLGRVANFKGRNKFGVTELDQTRGLLETLEGHINIAPNGIMYVKPSVRKGLLARMLTELLETRVMVKQAMKSVKEDKALKKILDARQLGLKYIANVTYGYTSATYSGRMPAVEIADSIVQSGRETLEKAVRTIDATKKWGAKVVYGDTDSLFIYLRGKTKEQAFRIGHDIADTITALNPAPVKLKFEKVYLPCVLMAKKRYVGFKYENPDDIDPVFDAKGIETVRRDGVPAQQKITENCLKILFRTQDLSQVKDYCCRTWLKMLENRVSIQDFIFAKEVKMGTYSDKGPPPPGVTVAARRLLEDPNDEPQYGERVPYVIIRGEPNSRLVDRAIAPQDLLANYHMHLDAAYYISRTLIPPLERIFNLVGANVRTWYDEMPKTIRADRAELSAFSPKKTRKDAGANKLKIDEHFRSSQCIICGDVTSNGICDVCRSNPQTIIPELLGRIRKGESRLIDVQRICESCTNSAPGEPIECVSIDCAWLFERKKVERKAEFLVVLQDLVNEIESDM